jgi:hypothetical protein
MKEAVPLAVALAPAILGVKLSQAGAAATSGAAVAIDV